jgi:hypothetical protein
MHLTIIHDTLIVSLIGGGLIGLNDPINWVMLMNLLYQVRKEETTDLFSLSARLSFGDSDYGLRLSLILLSRQGMQEFLRITNLLNI